MERESHREIEPKQKGLELTESEKTYLATKFMRILDRLDDEFIPEYLNEHVDLADEATVNHINRFSGDIKFNVFQDLCKLFGLSDIDRRKAAGGPGSVSGSDRLKSLISEEDEGK